MNGKPIDVATINAFRSIIEQCHRGGVFILREDSISSDRAALDIVANLLNNSINIEEICLTRTPEGIRMRVETFEVQR